MKNLFLKTLVIGLFLLVIPTRIWAQEVQIRDYENGFLFNVFTIENVEERVQLASALATSDIWLCNPTDHPGELFIRPNNQNEDIPVYAEFDYLRTALKAEYKEASLLPKEEFTEIFNSWACNISKDYYRFLISDLTDDRANQCMDAEPFCTTNVYNFPALNSGVSWVGPNYGCLGSSPTTKQSFWYYMRIGVAGNITIKIEASFDVDFALWGPFGNEIEPCPTTAGQAGQLTANCSDCPNNTTSPNFYPSGNLHDCSYSGYSYEFAHIKNGQVGQYFILLITNWAGGNGNITFQKYSGDGETDCSIMPPLVDNNGPYCIGETITLTGNAQQGASYSWSGPGGWTANGQTVTRPNCNLSMSGEYTCTIHVGNQSSSATTQVQVYARPTANFTATTVCKGNPTQFTSTSTTNPTGQTITSYLWDFGDGQTSTQQNPSHTFSTAGNKTVSLTVGIGNGACTSTKTQSVTVSPQPVANAGTDQTIIYGASAPLSGSGGTGSFNYHWEPADKVVNPNAQNTQTKPLTAQQTFTLTVSSPQGNCTDSDQMIVHIEGSNMTMAPSASPTAICEGSSSQLDAHAGGGTGNFTYSWTPTTGLSNPRIANPIASPTSTTTYTCTASDGMTTLSGTATVTVNHPEFEEETHYICPGDVYNFHGTDYSDVGDYPYQTTTAQGCDKTITLHLRHYPSYSDAHTTYANICAGESYTFHGHDYSTSGRHPEHLQTIHGCDSTVWLNLTVYPDNGITPDSVTVCPEQLPYYFYGVPYDHEVEVTHTDHDIHGCDSLVKLVLSINDYATHSETQYIAFDNNPSYTWPVNGQTLTEEGTYIDTLPSQYCECIYTLHLHFLEAPEPQIYYDTACDSHTWWISGTHYDFELPDGSISHSLVKQHFDDLAPYHYEDGRPCEQEHRLYLQMYKTSDHEADTIVENACNSFTWYFGHNGEHETYYENGPHTKSIKSKNSLMHCDSIVTLTIQNMIYTPQPEIVCADNGIEWPHHPITATEFNVNKYTYSVVDPHGTDSWINSQCQWKISKEEWPIKPSEDNLSCDVYAMDWVQDTIWLTFIAVNPCSPDGVDSTRYYLKPSFYGVQDQESYPAAVNIAPNPNSGQMQLRFENLEGKLSIKVYSITGLLQDSFEITTSQTGETYDYSMKRLVNGVYFFVITDGKRSVTKKVVIIN